MDIAIAEVWRAEGDGAYRGDEIAEKLTERGLKSLIHRRAYRHRERSRGAKGRQHRAKVRARVEHVFGDRKNSMGAGIMRTIGIVRGRYKIGMTNLVYNIRRFVFLERMATATG